MPKPMQIQAVSKTEIVVTKRGSSARYIREGRTKVYAFKEVVKLLSSQAAFPLTIKL